ncbi:MAG: Inner membrane transport permease YadH [Alphaproteobacteria bacterium MarineAlpha2_Bin1]|nr:MAG: Inner membrane transport permease YadH [Alphaproteobacteria bacterium MarineAlpha2_Bin1]|tara:strand:+ start:3124 stop:3933 length:810 start_codon:yes stop_codon:yes gene_type:complete
MSLYENGPAPNKHYGLFNWYGVFTLYKKEFLRFMGMPMQTLVAPAMTAILFLIVFSIAIGRGNVDVAGIPFNQFIVPGLIMMAIIQNAFSNATSSLMISKLQGNIVDILMPPLTSIELLIGLTLGGATRGIVVGAFVALVLYFFVEVSFHNFFFIISFSFLGSILLSLIGVIVGIWAYKFDEIATITNFIITPLSFLSGTFYSVDRLPEIFQKFTLFNPFFYMIDGFRSGFIGYSDSNLIIGLVYLLGLNVIMFIVGYFIIHKGYKLKS